MTKSRIAIVFAILALGLSAYLAVRVATLRKENRTLQKQVESMAQRAEEPARTEDVSSSRDAVSLSEKQMSELLRLRGEVGLLREELRKNKSEVETLRSAAAKSANVPIIPAATGAAGESFLKESWTFAGYATPEAALQTWSWAVLKGDSGVALESLAPEMEQAMAEHFKGKTDSELAAEGQKSAEKIIGYEILGREDVSDHEAILEIRVNQHNKAGPGRPQKMKFLTINGQWKVAGPAGG